MTKASVTQYIHTPLSTTWTSLAGASEASIAAFGAQSLVAEQVHFFSFAPRTLFTFADIAPPTAITTKTSFT